MLTKITDEKLLSLYLEKGLNCEKIAALVGYKGGESISRRLKKLNIRIRNSYKHVDISGQTIGNMIVLSFAYMNRGNSYWNCECKHCGIKRTIIKSAILTTKCCQKKNRVKDISGMKVNKLTVIKFAYVLDGCSYWECLCDCKNKIILSGSRVTTGQRKDCGCSKSLIGMKYGLLTVVERDKTTIGKKHPRWFCECACGSIKHVTQQQLASGETISCGCAKSYYESLLYDIMKQIFSKKQYYVGRNVMFDWLYNKKTKGRQKIDIVVFKKQVPILFIEYDGQQHFKPVRFGSITAEEAQEKLKYTKKQDKRKNRLVNKNKKDGIFIRFNYKERLLLNKDYVVEKLKEHGVL